MLGLRHRLHAVRCRSVLRRSLCSQYARLLCCSCHICRCLTSTPVRDWAHSSRTINSSSSRTCGGPRHSQSFSVYRAKRKREFPIIYIYIVQLAHVSDRVNPPYGFQGFAQVTFSGIDIECDDPCPSGSPVVVEAHRSHTVFRNIIYLAAS